MDIAHAFSRTEMLIGTEGLERLEQSHVAVFGAGGVGSHCIEALARSGVGTLSLIDHDTVSLTNINRQSMAFFSTIGRRKTEVLKERIADIAPDCRVYTWETFVLPENVNALMEEIRERAGGPPDYIIDAIDTVAAKIALAQYGDRTKILLIASMGTGNKLHPELFQNRLSCVDSHISHDQDLFQLLVKILINIRKTVKNAVDPVDDIVSCLGQPLLQATEKTLFFLSHTCLLYMISPIFV